MNITLIAVAVIVIVVGFVASRNTLVNQIDEQSHVETSEDVLSKETEEAEEPMATATSTPTKAPVTAAPAMTPSPTQSPASQPKASSDWIYPNSRVDSSSGKLVLFSSDSTDTITDWYKGRIESEGYNTKSFVKTSANDKVKNVMQGAKGGESVNVEITKNPGDSEARIEVTSSSV